MNRYKDAPVHRAILTACWKKFPIRWLEHLKQQSSAMDAQIPVGQSQGDQDLMFLSIACYVIMMGIGNLIPSDSTHLAIVTPNNVVPNMTIASIYDTYRGDLPFSIQSDCRQWFMHIFRTDLRKTCLKAFRSSIKLTVDQAIEGEPQTFEELQVSHG